MYTGYLVNTDIEQGGKDCVKGLNISLNRYFTSMVIVERCLGKNSTIIGALKSDRKGIPKERKEAAAKDGPVCESNQRNDATMAKKS